jgi:DNA repair exonuclease SbcCD ATPase subunit
MKSLKLGVDSLFRYLKEFDEDDTQDEAVEGLKADVAVLSHHIGGLEDADQQVEDVRGLRKELERLQAQAQAIEKRFSRANARALDEGSPIPLDRQDTPPTEDSLRERLDEISQILKTIESGEQRGEEEEDVRDTQLESLKIEMDGLTQQLNAAESRDKQEEEEEEDVRDTKLKSLRAEVDGLYHKVQAHVVKRLMADVAELTHQLEELTSQYSYQNREVRKLMADVAGFSDYLAEAAQNGMEGGVENVANIVGQMVEYRAEAAAIEKRRDAADLNGEYEEEIAEAQASTEDRLMAKLAEIYQILREVRENGPEVRDEDKPKQERRLVRLRTEMDGLTQQLDAAMSRELPALAEEEGEADQDSPLARLKAGVAKIAKRFKVVESGDRLVGSKEAAALSTAMQELRAGVDDLCHEAQAPTQAPTEDSLRAKLDKISQILDTVNSREQGVAEEEEEQESSLASLSTEMDKIIRHFNRAVKSDQLGRGEQGEEEEEQESSLASLRTEMDKIVMRLDEMEQESRLVRKKEAAALSKAMQELMIEVDGLCHGAQAHVVERLRTDMAEIIQQFRELMDQYGPDREERELMERMRSVFNNFDRLARRGQKAEAERVPKLVDLVAHYRGRVIAYKVARLRTEVIAIYNELRALVPADAQADELKRLKKLKKAVHKLYRFLAEAVQNGLKGGADEIAQIVAEVEQYRAAAAKFTRQYGEAADSNGEEEDEAPTVESLRAKLDEISQILETAGSRGQHVREEEEDVRDTQLESLRTDVDDLTQQLTAAESRDKQEEEEEEDVRDTKLESLRAEVDGLYHKVQAHVVARLRTDVAELTHQLEELAGEDAQDREVQTVMGRVSAFFNYFDGLVGGGRQVGADQVTKLVGLVEQYRARVIAYKVKRLRTEVFAISNALEELAPPDAQADKLKILKEAVNKLYRFLAEAVQNGLQGGADEIAQIVAEVAEYRAEADEFISQYGEAADSNVEEEDEIVKVQTLTVASLRERLADLTQRLEAAEGGEAEEAVAIVGDVEALRDEMYKLVACIAYAGPDDDVEALRADMATLTQRFEEAVKRVPQEKADEAQELRIAKATLIFGVDAIYTQAQMYKVARLKSEVHAISRTITAMEEAGAQDAALQRLKKAVLALSLSIAEVERNGQQVGADEVAAKAAQVEQYRAEAAEFTRKYGVAAEPNGEEEDAVDLIGQREAGESSDE